MAFFSFRKSSAAEAKAPARAPAAASTETVQTLRRRARHRLVGAAVLVLLAVIGFPLLFDTEPRPVVVDAPITIPDRESVPPLKVPATTPPPTQTQTHSQPRAPVDAPAAAKLEASKPDAPAAAATQTTEPAHSQAAPAPVAATAAEDAARNKREAEAQARREQEAKTQRDQEAKARRDAETARAQALLEGRSAPKPAAKAETGRFIVQIGAFADADKVQEARRKIERAGLKTYTQVAETPDGKRTRVRVGPFTSRAEAEKAAETLQQIGLPGNILSL